MAHPPRTGQRIVRVSRDVPQPPTTPHRTRNAHPDRVRTPTRQNRSSSLNSSNPTPRNQGRIKTGQAHVPYFGGGAGYGPPAYRHGRGHRRADSTPDAPCNEGSPGSPPRYAASRTPRCDASSAPDPHATGRALPCRSARGQCQRHRARRDAERTSTAHAALLLDVDLTDTAADLISRALGSDADRHPVPCHNSTSDSMTCRFVPVPGSCDAHRPCCFD
jgi:hypothetical protein